MSFFKTHGLRDAFAALGDWSGDLSDQVVASELARIGGLLDISALAYDPTLSLLAAGTKTGQLVVCGGPARHAVWSISPALAIKHLALHAPTGTCIVIDAHDTIQVFDLTAPTGPGAAPVRVMAHSARSTMMAIESSPSHSHMFLGYQDGSVECFDIERLAMSPYRVPNLGLEAEELLRRSGVPGAPRRTHVPVCTDVKQCPTALDLLLVAYESTIALYSLSERRTVASYEVLIPPGARGGGNDDDETSLTERRPPITCLSWRPDGRVFVAGTADGVMAFFDRDEPDVPLLVRTFDDDDVNLLSESSMFTTPATGRDGRRLLREPIFKIVWTLVPQASGSGGVLGSLVTDPGESKTALVVLGGLLQSDWMGVHVLHLAASHPGPPGREAARAALQAQGHSVYGSQTAVEDFIVAHGSIVLLSAPLASTTRSLSAFTYPPSLTSEASRMALPSMLELSGGGAPIGFELVNCSNEARRRLGIAAEASAVSRVGLSGGTVEKLDDVARPSGPDAFERDRHRLLVTWHHDLSVCIHDASTPSAGATTDFPAPLHRIDVAVHLPPDSAAHRLWVQTPDLLSVISVQLATETGDVAVALSSGEVLIFRLGPPPPREAEDDGEDAAHEAALQPIALSEAGPPIPDASKPLRPRRSSKRPKPLAVSAPVDVVRIVMPTAASDRHSSTFHLACTLVGIAHGPALVALTDVGFVAAAWGPAVAIVDLRGFDVVSQESGPAPVVRLDWTIAEATPTLDLAPRLIVSHANGTVRVLSLAFTLDNWILSHVPVPPIISGTDVLATFVFGPRGGVELVPTADRLRMVMSPRRQASDDDGRSAKADIGSILVRVGPASASARANFVDTRLAKVEFGGRAMAARAVERHRRAILVVVMDSGKAEVYTLPDLKPALDNAVVVCAQPPSRVSICADGDLVYTTRAPDSPLVFASLFGAAASKRPSYAPTTVLAPAQASALTSIASYAGSWLGTKTGAGLDALLAGPHRPAKKEPLHRPRPAPSRPQPRAPRPAPTTTAREDASHARTTVGETNDALRERGERLGALNDTIDDIARGASDMVKSAKRMALQEGAKARITGWFS